MVKCLVGKVVLVMGVFFGIGEVMVIVLVEEGVWVVVMVCCCDWL